MRRKVPMLAVIPLTALGFSQLIGQSHSAQASVIFSHALTQLTGNSLQVKLVEVTYAPGQSSAPHSHPCPVVGYVLEGAVRMRIGKSPEAVYKVGDTFYEDANAHHLVSANASSSEKARFLAYLICDREVTSLSVPVPNDGR